MRILLVTSEDLEVGGVASVIGNLARELQGRGHNVIFLNPGETTFLKMKTTKWGFIGFELNLQLPYGHHHHLINLALFLIRFPIAMCQLIRLIQKHRIEIINIHYPADCFVYFALCRRILPIALVTSVHGADLFPNGRPKVKYPRAIRFLLSASDRVVANSLGYQKDVSSVFPELKEKVLFIHNSVNLPEFDGDCRDAGDHRARYILCVAMHNEKKGIDVLLRAFASFKDTEPSVNLLLAGDGPLRVRLEDLALSLEIQDRVEFLGRQRPVQVKKLLHGCDIFVLPSRSEPFGIVIIEAMACKKPVIATSVGGIPEIIENGKNGILVKPDNPKALANALITVLNDRALQRDLAENGYRTVRERFRTEHTGSAYEALFGALLDSRGKGTLQAA